MAEVMKDSKTRWLGQIPVDWGMVRVKDCFDRKNKKANQKDPVVLSLARSGVKIRDISSNEGQLAADYTNYNPVAKDDILINPMDLVSGDNCNISRVEGVISPAYVNLRHKKGINPRFYNYYFKLQYWLGAFFAYGFGVSFDNRWTLSYETLSKYPLILPPSSEQDKIADFLDEKCAEIDKLSEDIQKQIDILNDYKKSVITRAVTKGLDPNAEMKESGVQWIGLMPSHWAINRGKFILKYLQKPTRETDGIITCFRDGEVTLRSNRREEGFTVADKEIGYQGIDIGDLVVHGMDGFAGAIGISDSRGKASPVINVLDTAMDKKYIMYYLRSMAYSDVFLNLATGIRVRSCDLRWNKLANLEYPIPPVEEQKKISSYIENVLEATNKTILTEKDLYKRLQDYKKSIIYEYVTGKKRVKGSL